MSINSSVIVIFESEFASFRENIGAPQCPPRTFVCKSLCTSTTHLLCLQVNVAVVLIQIACLYMDIQTSISKNVYINKAYPSYAKKTTLASVRNMARIIG